VPHGGREAERSVLATGVLELGDALDVDEVDPYWRRLPTRPDDGADALGNRWRTGSTAQRWGTTAERWSGGARAVQRAGAVANFGLAGFDQWRSDARDPRLSTADRVGRTGAAAVYVGGASVIGGMAGAKAGAMVGATVGTMVGGPIGTAVGGAIGGIVGGVVGSGVAGGMVNHFTGAKDVLLHGGAATANGVAEGLECARNVASKAISDLTPW